MQLLCARWSISKIFLFDSCFYKEKLELLFEKIHRFLIFRRPKGIPNIYIGSCFVSSFMFLSLNNVTRLSRIISMLVKKTFYFNREIILLPLRRFRISSLKLTMLRGLFKLLFKLTFESPVVCATYLYRINPRKQVINFSFFFKFNANPVLVQRN